MKKFCPVIALKNWIEIFDLKKGRIFDISDKSVALIIKKYASYAGLDSHRYAGHSLRSGFATSTAEPRVSHLTKREMSSFSWEEASSSLTVFFVLSVM